MSETYDLALDGSAAEEFGGHYQSDEFWSMDDRDAIINQAIALISGSGSNV